MKNIYFSLLFLSLSLLSFSQTVRVDYDNSSKWFLGINGGGTWHSTDVKYQVGGGWGLTLGKSYNYNYGRPLTFDIRGRYLNGNWYGQDKDSTALSGLTQDNALYGYQSTPGYTYHNFKSNIHRLALELAIHLNAITQRTGWDPYVFGGVGITWNQTKGNLSDSSEIMLGADPYSYGPNGLGGITYDNSYETPLDGYEKYNVNFMPSLGFGLGYHIGKRTTFGIEHKTTFTLADNFDAVQSTIRSKNDLYHYTSLYLQFRFWGGPHKTNDNINSNSNINNFNNPCQTPEIILTNVNTFTVTNSLYNLEFYVQGVNASNEIQILNNDNIPILFNYNYNTRKVFFQSTLKQGMNQFKINIKNKCGSDNEIISVFYETCKVPSGNFTNPAAANMSTNNSSYLLNAVVQNVQSKSDVKVFVNNFLISDFYFNNVNGLIQTNLQLQPGINTIKLELSNSCGNTNLESSIFYNNCVSPTINFTNPTNPGITVNKSSFAFSSKVTSISNKNQINLSINGLNVTEFTFVNGTITANLNLFQGQNNIVINVTNPCGNSTQQTMVILQSCIPPTIQLLNGQSATKVTSPIFNLKSKIENIENKQNISFKLNNVELTNVNYNQSTKLSDMPLNLTPGVNTIQIVASNECGVDIETLNIEYYNCKTPTISITSSSTNVVNSSYNLTALISEIPSSSGITVTRNGQNLGFSFINGQLISAVNLLPGINTFVIKASNECGTDNETISVNYNDCSPPTLSVLQPLSGITINADQINVQLSSANVSNVGQIEFKINNQLVSPTLTNGLITANVSLMEGNNTIIVKLTNACGTVSKSIQVTRKSCVPPSVSFLTPIQNTIVTSSNIGFTASVLNTENYSLEVNGIASTATRNGNTIVGNINLIPGNNTIQLNGTNYCGTDSKTLNIIYNNCQPPIISLSVGNLVVSEPVYLLSANITNSTQSSIVLTFNGLPKNFDYNSNLLTSNLNLSPGENTISISTTNSCGHDLENFTINYNPCVPPQINVQNPSTQNSTINVGTFNYQALISGSVASNQISFEHNQTPISNFTYSNGVFSAQVSLVTGSNLLKLKIQNECGTINKEVNIIGKTCLSPQISLSTQMTNVTTSQQFVFASIIQNVNATDGIILSLNGSIVSPISFINGNLQANLMLNQGQNSIVVIAENECGNTTKTHTVSYSVPCFPPEVTFVNLPPSGSSINANTISLSAQIANYTESTSITVKVNGNITNNYQNNNGFLSGTINLPNVPLVIEITASNACGSNTSSYTISKCKPASLSLVSPASNNYTTTTSSHNLIFNVYNISNVSQVQISNNGQQLSNVTLNGSQVSVLIPLASGSNAINISITTSCNQLSENLVILFNQPNTQNNGSSIGNGSINNNGGTVNSSSTPQNNPNTQNNG
ncbi:MAG: hypothetical protein EBS34_02950, partial [Flavobacteriales bacterium]|nr:hypothetical protein [Flavobacteriales bacterium]